MPIKNIVLVLLSAGCALLSACAPDEQSSPEEDIPEVASTSQAIVIPVADRATTIRNAWEPYLLLQTRDPSPDGTYCLDAGNNTAGTQVMMAPCNNSSAQQWARLDWLPQTVVAVDSGLCLDVTNNLTADGSYVQLWPCHGGLNQRWSATQYGGLKSASSGKCLQTIFFGMMGIYECENRAVQQWTRTPSVLRSALSGRCLDINTANGALQIWDCHGAWNQQWRQLSRGAIYNDAGRCLYPVGNGTENGTPVQAGPCSATQSLFRMREDGSLYHLKSMRCLDVIGGSGATENGTGLQLWDCHGEANQRWGTR